MSEAHQSPRKVPEPIETTIKATATQQVIGNPNNITEEATSIVDSFEQNERIIKNLKPLLKKNCLHLGQNSIVTWKSFEIWLIE
jgi:hypothetical protein